MKSYKYEKINRKNQNYMFQKTYNNLDTKHNGKIKFTVVL